MGSFRLLFFVICITLSTAAFSSQTLTKTEALRDVQTFLTELRTHYGMVEEKEKNFNVTLDEVEKKYTDLVMRGLSLEGHDTLDASGNWKREELEQLIVGLAAEFRDGHTNFKRNTPDGWTLGIKTADIGGKLIVVGDDPNFFVNKNLTSPLEVGDEVVEVDGRPVQDIAKEIMIYAQTATFDARQMWALEHVLDVPSGFLRSKKNGEQVRVKFRKYTSGEEVTGYFNWTNVKDFIRARTGLPRAGNTSNRYFFGYTGTTESYFHSGLMNLGLPEGSILDIGVLVNNDIKKEIAKYRQGRPGAADAADLKVIERLDVYTVSFAGASIGVIRIPNYSPPGGFNDVLSELAYLRRAIKYLNQHSNMVIIDQLSNNGGYVAYVSELARLFAGKQGIPAVTANIRVTQSYLRAMDSGKAEKAASHQPDLPNFAEMNIHELLANRLREKLEAGEKYSGYLPYMGTVDNINEGDPGVIVAGDSPTYEGKVMILNDRRSASGGDFFPAIMQKVRALVFGSTSRGLGGPVYNSIDSLGAVQMFFRCAFAVCRRATGLPFENVGVVPDVQRDFTVEDLRRGGATFSLDALRAAVLYLQNKTPEEITTFIHKKTLAPVIVSDTTKFLDDKAAAVLKVAEKGSVNDLVLAYDSLKAEFLEKSKDVPPEEFSRLQIPVPSVLFEKDLILSSIKDRKAVLDRLNDMAKLPRFQNDPDLARVIEALRSTISSTHEDVGVLTPCSLKLSNLVRRVVKKN